MSVALAIFTQIKECNHLIKYHSNFTEIALLFFNQLERHMFQY